jgi:CheY-like chemotaxis protein
LTNQNPAVLIIEDDADSRALFKRALETENYGVTTEACASVALGKLAAGLSPRLILLDLTMPGMDGADFLLKLKQLPNSAGIKVVLVSGWADVASRAETLGADGYLRKPIELRTFSREIKKHLPNI